MTDPRDDPRTPWLLSVVPDEVGRLAADFGTAARESADTAVGLTAAQHDGHWTGRAAEAFRDSIGRLPRQLERLHAGYAAVQRALSAYEDALSEIQPKFRTTYNEYVALHGPLDAALGQDRVGNEAEPLRARCQRLLEDFSQARHACRTAIAAAGATAPVAHRRHGGSGTTVVGVVEGGGVAMAGAGSSGGGGRQPASRSPRGRAQEQLHTMLRTAKSLLGVPYVSGGGHGSWTSGGGLDCSGFVSHVLHAGGFLSGPQTTEGFASQPGIAAGHGQFVTIYDRTGCGANEHVIIDLNGHFFEEGGGSGSGGAPFVHRFAPSPEYLASFQTVLHPVGL